MRNEGDLRKVVDKKSGFWRATEGLGPRSKTEAFQDYLYSRLRTGEFAPGMRLRQDQLALSLGISSTPVREGLNRLVAEGLLTHSPNKGVRVREASPASIKEVYAIRLELEGFAAREAATRLSGEDLERLASLHAKMARLQSPGQRREFWEVNDEFHWIICEAAGSTLLLGIIRRLWAASPWDAGMVFEGRSKISVKEHGRVLDALRARDGALAEDAMDDHIRNFVGAVLEITKGE